MSECCEPDIAGLNWAYMMTQPDGVIIMAEWLRSEPAPRLVDMADWVADCRLCAEKLVREVGAPSAAGIVLLGEDSDDGRASRMCVFLHPGHPMLSPISEVMDPLWVAPK